MKQSFFFISLFVACICFSSSSFGQNEDSIAAGKPWLTSTTHSIKIDNKIINYTAKAGTLNKIKSAIFTLPAKKIIKVVTSPVINAAPPEFTANTTKTI